MTYFEVLPNLHLLHLFFCVELITLIITQQFDSNLQNPELYKANNLLIHQHLLITPIILRPNPMITVCGAYTMRERMNFCNPSKNKSLFWKSTYAWRHLVGNSRFLKLVVETKPSKKPLELSYTRNQGRFKMIINWCIFFSPLS